MAENDSMDEAGNSNVRSKRDYYVNERRCVD